MSRSLYGITRRDFMSRMLGFRLCGAIISGSTLGFGESPASPGTPPVRFENVASAAGLDFVLHNHPTPQKHLIETMTGGIAAFDCNHDGLTDIFFTNGASIPSFQKDSPEYFNRLYRNEGGCKFTDVTEQAGVAGAGYSMGAAAADYNNDGHVDLLVAGVFRNILYRNLGNGRFEDVTEMSGIKSDKWSVAAGWFDYDNDGWLDLFVVNYAKWSLADNRFCGDRERSIRTYCHPKYLDGLPCTLYRNKRDGTFEDVTRDSGIGKSVGRGMSVAFADYDHDGFLDAFVTNDNQANFLFHNRRDGTFEEVGLMAGVALMNSGEPVSNMGVDFRDYDNDGLPDIAVTDLSHETFPLFRNLGNGMFEDASYSSRLAMLTAPLSGWGNGFFDFNNDGWKDLFTANSHVDNNVRLFQPGTHYRQANSIFINARDGTFTDGSAAAGPEFQIPRAHRGAAFADFDGDGKIDVVVSCLGGQPELWRNISPEANNWIIFKLHGSKSNHDGIGARIQIGKQVNHMSSSVGYASSSHFGVHFGLGAVQRIPHIEIRWPSGKVQALEDIAANQVLQVHEP
ncbi:MAG TPA: CRTAC1 family protein [Terriglobia bacterium]|nr:CRTAC1 family protein [Terriglobia bacterium]